MHVGRNVDKLNLAQVRDFPMTVHTKIVRSLTPNRQKAIANHIFAKNK